MNERLRLIRENIGISRAAFGQQIGVSGDVINNLERGRVEIKEHILKLICSEFSVNEAWLRTGSGEMFMKTPSSIMEQLKTEFDLDEFSYSLVHEYLKLDQAKRKTIRDFLYRVVEGENGSSDLAELSEAHELTVEELEAKYKKTISSSVRNTSFTASNTTDDKESKKAIG